VSSTVSAESLPGAGPVDSGPPAAAKPGVVPSVWGTDWGANDLPYFVELRGLEPLTPTLPGASSTPDQAG
jgi:hypothetical protein